MARKKPNVTPAYRRHLTVMTRSKKRAADIDAAMRVFGVPELLEQILLLAVSDQTPTRDDWRSETLKLGPMPGAAKESYGGICIFSLQLVNKSFYATINGSARLKRLVYLAAYPNRDLHASSTTRKALLPFHTPLYAMLDKLHENSGNHLLDWGWQYNRNHPPSADDLTTRLDIGIWNGIIRDKSLYEEAISKLAPGWWYPEANWRRIKVCNAKKLVSLTVRMFHFHHVAGTGSYGAHLTWGLHGDESLGYVFDFFCKLLQLIDEGRTATRIIERKWQARMDEAEARFKSHRDAVGYHRVSEETRLADQQERQDLRSNRVHELEAELTKLKSAVEEWELSVKREPAAQMAGETNEK